jgi:DNA-binding transcriptional LysR family regulator
MSCTSIITVVQLDLNLLNALDVLLEEGSVGGAADRLHLSQPAMSRTLGRIRRTTGDQILVRSGRAMVPTPYALAVREEVHAVVQQAHALLAPERDLDLASLDRVFTLQWHDAVTSAVGPDLLATIQAVAPGVRLRLLAEASTDTDDLRTGRTDLAIGSAVPAVPEFRSETVGHDRLVVALRAEHPLSHGHLTAAQYAAAIHVTVSRRGRLEDPIDDLLAMLGLRRHVAATVPTSAAALRFAARSDIFVVVPEVMCAGELQALDLLTVPLPLEVPPVPIIMAWHQRYDGDKAHSWLRELARTTLRGMLAS